MKIILPRGVFVETDEATTCILVEVTEITFNRK